MAVKLMVWNMEWLNDLFGPNDDPPAWRSDDHHPQHAKSTTVAKRRDDLAGVINDIQPQLVVVVEAPNRTDELQLFFDHAAVSGTWKTWVQPSPKMSQCVGLAVRTDGGAFQNPPFAVTDTVNEEAFDPFLLDTDSDNVQEQHKYERRPLLVTIHPDAGVDFSILGLHLKSKAIFDALEWSRWWERAEGDRKKLLAQATELRLKFLDPYLADPSKPPLIVCGDINDGPGLDAAEKRIFGSAIERLMGTVWRPDLTLGNALFDTLDNDEKAVLDFSGLKTTSFKDPIFSNVWHRVWIDHVLYSRGVPGWVGKAKIHQTMSSGNPIWDEFPDASDHYPITVEITT